MPKSKHSPEFRAKVSQELQFTVLGGRHSVLERPLSEAKRPFILAN